MPPYATGRWARSWRLLAVLMAWFAVPGFAPEVLWLRGQWRGEASDEAGASQRRTRRVLKKSEVLLLKPGCFKGGGVTAGGFKLLGFFSVLVSSAMPAVFGMVLVASVTGSRGGSRS